MAIKQYTKDYRYASVKVVPKPLRVLFSCNYRSKYNFKGNDTTTNKSKQYKNTGLKKYRYLMKVITTPKYYIKSIDT
jgi:hypothetical protein